MMLALAAQLDETLEDALRAALGVAVEPHRRRRADVATQQVRCVVCHEPAQRERALDGEWITACSSCGSVLEEPADRPQLRLL
jgi:ribosomal protein L37AE/L43A